MKRTNNLKLPQAIINEISREFKKDVQADSIKDIFEKLADEYARKFGIHSIQKIEFSSLNNIDESIESLNNEEINEILNALGTDNIDDDFYRKLSDDVFHEEKTKDFVITDNISHLGDKEIEELLSAFGSKSEDDDFLEKLINSFSTEDITNTESQHPVFFNKNFFKRKLYTWDESLLTLNSKENLCTPKYFIKPNADTTKEKKYYPKTLLDDFSSEGTGGINYKTNISILINHFDIYCKENAERFIFELLKGDHTKSTRSSDIVMVENNMFEMRRYLFNEKIETSSELYRFAGEFVPIDSFENSNVYMKIDFIKNNKTNNLASMINASECLLILISSDNFLNYFQKIRNYLNYVIRNMVENHTSSSNFMKTPKTMKKKEYKVKEIFGEEKYLENFPKEIINIAQKNAEALRLNVCSKALEYSMVILGIDGSGEVKGKQIKLIIDNSEYHHTKNSDILEGLNISCIPYKEKPHLRVLH